VRRKTHLLHYKHLTKDRTQNLRVLQSYDTFFDAIELKLGDKLRAEGIKPLLFGYTWIEVASLEYVYFSISGAYKSSGDVKKALFYRILRMAGIEEPRKFATDEDRDYLMEQYTSLKLRPEVKECFQKLRNAGFTIWCLTTGNAEKILGFFEQGGVDMPKENVTSVSLKFLDRLG